MKVILAMNNSCIVAAHFVVCHGGDLGKRAELPLDPQTLRVHVDVGAVHDFFHRVVLEFYFILDLLLLNRLFLVLIISAARGGVLFDSYGVILTHNVIHLPI